MAFIWIISSDQCLDPVSWLLSSEKAKCSSLYAHLLFFLKTKMCLCLISKYWCFVNFMAKSNRQQYPETCISIFIKLLSHFFCLLGASSIQNVVSLVEEMCFITNWGKINRVTDNCLCMSLSNHYSKWKQNTSNFQSLSCHHSFSFWMLRHKHMLSTTVMHRNLCYPFWDPDILETNPHVQREASENQSILQIHSPSEECDVLKRWFIPL